MNAVRWRKVRGGAVFEQRTQNLVFRRWEEVGRVSDEALASAKTVDSLTRIADMLWQKKEFAERMRNSI